MQRRITIITVAALALAALLGTLAATGQGSQQKFLRATLSGFEEVPAVSTAATGSFTALVSPDDGTIEYTLSYRGLQGSVVQAHVHFGQVGVNGGIVFWLCGTESAPGPAGTPTCPQDGTVSGTVTAADILATAPAQQVAAGDLAAVLRAMRAGVTEFLTDPVSPEEVRKAIDRVCSLSEYARVFVASKRDRH